MAAARRKLARSIMRRISSQKRHAINVYPLLMLLINDKAALDLSKDKPHLY
jgi:hypothetical protein